MICIHHNANTIIIDIYFSGLAWTFSAETLAILFVQVGNSGVDHPLIFIHSIIHAYLPALNRPNYPLNQTTLRQVLVGLCALTRTQSLVTAGFILSLYPLSLVLVYVLQNVLGFD